MITILQCDSEVPAGIFTEQLTAAQVPWRLVRLYDGEPLPEPAGPVIVLGGTMGVYDDALHPFLSALKIWLRWTVRAGIPTLGICLGGQLLACSFGGTVRSNTCGERGLQRVDLTEAAGADPLLTGFPSSFSMFQWHNDCFDPPPGATLLASSPACPAQAFRYGNAWGLQFHPEVTAAIVAAWSGDATDSADCLATFRAAEGEHRRLAQRLLTNFLTAQGGLV